MAASYTTTDFLNSVRQRGSIPTTTNSANVNNTTNLLALATEELHINLLPLLLSVREEFYVATENYTVTAEEANYPLPARASGMAVRSIHWVDGSTVYELLPVDPEQITTTASGTVVGYYLEHNNIVLYPTPGATSGTLRVKYFQRPNRLATTSACAQISAIDTGTSTVTVSSVPSTFTATTECDFIGRTVPYLTLGADYAIVSATTSTITFASLPDDLAVGDWVALAEYSPIPQIPHEFQSVLAQMTVVRALQAINDLNGAKLAEAALDKLTKKAVELITPRNQGSPRKVINRNWRR